MSRAVLLLLLGMILIDIISALIGTNRSNIREALDGKILVPQARILVVDDFAPWRNQLRSLLKTRPEWNVIGEASDGQEAIDKATEMDPDVVLLDIGMPSLNGIEAATIIRQRCPNSEILFVTQEYDDDVRNAAMRTGAAGYVLKMDVVTELVDAISAALYRYAAVPSTKSR